jgi:hypothetical protein
MLGWLLAGVLTVAGSGLRAQATLAEAAARARQLWLAHDVAGLLAGADTVRLQLPGLETGASLAPGQAARVLERYLAPAREIGFELEGVRPASADHGYAQGSRRYVVQGTSEERRETVYFGFRVLGGAWRTREVRIVP